MWNSCTFKMTFVVIISIIYYLYYIIYYWKSLLKYQFMIASFGIDTCFHQSDSTDINVQLSNWDKAHKHNITHQNGGSTWMQH